MSHPTLNWGRLADGDGKTCSVKLADGGELVIDDYDNGEVIVLLVSPNGQDRAIYECGRPSTWSRFLAWLSSLCP